MTESEKKEVVVAYQVLDAILSETTTSILQANKIIKALDQLRVSIEKVKVVNGNS